MSSTLHCIRLLLHHNVFPLTLCGDAGAASEQGANTGSQGQKKKRRKLLVNLNRGAEPKASHATSDAAVSLMPDPTASSHHAARAQTGGVLCNTAVSEPAQGKTFCSC